jgi:hypothetical protein
VEEVGDENRISFQKYFWKTARCRRMTLKIIVKKGWKG